MIKMYENFKLNDNNNIYTNQEIYDYVKFINMICSDNENYKNIVKYITKDNFNFFQVYLIIMI